MVYSQFPSKPGSGLVATGSTHNRWPIDHASDREPIALDREISILGIVAATGCTMMLSFLFGSRLLELAIVSVAQIIF